MWSVSHISDAVKGTLDIHEVSNFCPCSLMVYIDYKIQVIKQVIRIICWVSFIEISASSDSYFCNIRKLQESTTS